MTSFSKTDIGLVPNSWTVVEFNDFTTLQRGKDLTRSEFKDGLIPVCGSSGIIGYHNESVVKGSGATVGRSGSAGKVAFYSCDFWAHNTVLYVKDFHGNDPRFSAFYLEHMDLARFKTGASVPTLDRNSFRKIKIGVPTLSEQKKIAYVLSTVQRAIAQQEKLIQTTTELKKALMHKLFTEGLHGEKQKETAIGLVPESWQILEFDEFTTLQRGKDLTKSQFEPGNIPVAGSNGIIGYHGQSNVKGAGVTVGRSGSVGRVKYYACDFWAHNTTLYVRDFHGNLPRFSAYFLEFLDLSRFRTGASVPTLDRNTFRRMKTAVPSLSEQKKIAEILELVDTKIDVESRKLASLRELFRTLLHHLMTAKTRVHDIDLLGFDDLVNITPQGSSQRSS